MRVMYVFASVWNTKDWIWSMEGRLGDFEDECRHYKGNAQGALFGESQPSSSGASAGIPTLHPKR